MAAVAFDPLEYTHQLEASGVPREQAEVHAKAMTAMFLHNFDALVTKDYLDSRFKEFETRMGAAVDTRFAASESTMDKRFAESESMMDKRFAESESRVDKRFAELESQIDRLSASVDSRIDLMSAEFDGKIVNLQVMLGVIMAGLSIPIIQTLVSWLS